MVSYKSFYVWQRFNIELSFIEAALLKFVIRSKMFLHARRTSSYYYYNNMHLFHLFYNYLNKYFVIVFLFLQINLITNYEYI